MDEDILNMQEKLIKLENEDRKADQHRRMAWVSMISLVGVMLFLFTPILPIERVTALDNLVTMFFIS